MLRLTSAIIVVASAIAPHVEAQRSAGARERHVVVADDRHQLTVWSKRPVTTPTGSILLLHGRRWSAIPNFDLQVPGPNRSVMDALVARGYAVYALDMRGNGATARDASGWLTPNRAVADVAATLDWIADRERIRAGRAVPRPALLGYSRGSGTAMLAAQRYPGTLSALVLYAFSFDVDTMLPRVTDPARPPRARNTPEGAAEDFILPAAVARVVRDAYVRAALQSDPVTVDWRRMDEFNALDPSAVRVPTLVISGARDPYASGTAHTRLFAKLATEDRSWVVLPNASHVAHIERSHEAWIHAVTTFLARPR